MYVAAIIIAKSFSRRIPRKNFKLFCGLPLVEWTFIQARAAKYIDAIYFVIDDNAELKEIGEKYDANIVIQPLAEIELAERRGALGGGYSFKRGIIAAMRDGADVCCCMFPTNPLRMPGEIDKAFEMWKKKPHRKIGTHSAIADICIYRPENGNEINRCEYWGGGTGLTQYTGSFEIGYCNQYLQQLFDDTGEMITSEAQAARKHEDQVMMVELWQTIDIDLPEDWDVCEYWMEHKILHGRGPAAYSTGSAVDQSLRGDA